MSSAPAETPIVPVEVEDESRGTAPPAPAPAPAPLSPWRAAWAEFRENRIALAALGVVIVLVALLGQGTSGRPAGR